MTKSFQQISAQEDTLLIVDTLNLAFRYKHSGILPFSDDYIKTVESLKKSYKAKKVILASDMGSSKYRKEIYPEYKQNRKDKHELQTEEEKLQFELFFEEFTNTLNRLAEETEYPVVRFPGVEADDVAAYIVANRKSYKSIKNIWLISSDKDWDLLIDNNVSRFSYVTRKETTLENWNTHYDFEPEDYISIKCLTGDTGDNVIGVNGIGPKRAQSLVSTYGSCWDIIASIPLDGKYKYIQELNKSKDKLILNYKLMDLVTHCREAVGEENCKQIDEILEIYLND